MVAITRAQNRSGISRIAESSPHRFNSPTPAPASCQSGPNSNSNHTCSSKSISSTSNCSTRTPITRTPSGHFVIVHNRRWRATDPLIPAGALAELRHFLGRGRSALRGHKATEQAARRKVRLAKSGLGERGKPEWWNDSDEGRRKRWESALEKLRSADGERPLDLKA